MHHSVTQSSEVEPPPAKAWWCPGALVVVCSEKLKDHRLKRWCPAPAPAPAPGLARDALVNFLGKTLNYPGSEKRSVAINDC